MTSSDVSWQEVRIGDFGKVVTGRTPPTSQHHLFGSDYPFITPTDISSDGRSVETARFLSDAGRDSLRKILLPSGATCFVCIGATIGKICMTDRSSFTNQQINSVVVDETRFDPGFVYYTLRALVREVKAIAGGAATPIVNKTAFSSIKVSCPPLAIQQCIASILSVYDDLIENNTRRIAILEEMARRIYEEWFVHFRFPGHENVRMVESDLGEVPEGWEAQLVKTIVRRLKAGRAYKQGDVSEVGDVMVVDQSRSEQLGFHDNEPDHIATPDNPIIIFGDHTCKMQIMVSPFSLGPNTVPFVSADETSVYYVYALVDGAVKTREYKRHWTELGNKRIAKAPRGLTERFEAVVKPMLGKTVFLHRKNRNLRTQRDLLLPKLISGEIDVAHAARAAEAEAAE